MKRDQFLAEMMGEQYPRYNLTASGNKEFQNFSLWPDKGRLIDFVMRQEWWDEFLWFCIDKTTADCYFSEAIKYLINNLPDLVAEYRGWKE